MRSSSLVLLLCMLNVSGQAQATRSGNGMVVSDNRLASEVGVQILRDGGNAVDGAIATAFALAVTHPQAGNIGGGGFLVLMDSAGNATTIDFRETAPLAASEDMFLDAEGNLERTTGPFGNSTTANHAGIKSVGVPGSVAGLYLAHQKYGSLPWERLVQPAIDLAEDGFALTITLANHADRFEAHAEITFLEEFFNTEEGVPAKAGEVWCQPELAKTLEEIRDHGHDGFYNGRVARKIARYMRKEGGLITREDLESYRAVERKPVSGSFGGYQVWSMAPPSSGGVTMIEMLNMITVAGTTHGGAMTETDSCSLEDGLPAYNSAYHVHLLAEVMRRGYADRAFFLGDPDFYLEMPVIEMISVDHAAELMATFDPCKASVSDSSEFNQLHDGANTTHLSVADRFGNAVSLTTTLEHSYGSGLGVPGLGFLLNNEMGDFNPVPGVTNSAGLIGTPPNRIEPGKRMLSSMTPTIVSKDGVPVIVIGSPGGRTIINTVFQSVLNMLAYEMPVDQAIEAVKIHHQWLPDRILYEEELLSPMIVVALEDMGHTIVPVENLGRLMGISIDPETGMMTGYSDSSSPDGAAVGY